MPAFDAATSATPSSGTSLTWSHTCSGDDRFLAAGGVHYNTGTMTATYNGVSMTRLDALGPTNNGWFYLTNPPSGAHNVVFTWSNTAANAAIAVSYTGVDQSTPFDGLQESTSTGSPVSVTVSSASANLVVGGVWGARGSAITATEGADQTMRANVSYSSQCIAISDEAGAASVTHSYTRSETASFGGHCWGINLRAAASGGATLAAETGTFSLTGHSAALTVQRRLTAATGAFTLTGHDAGLRAGRRLPAETGAFALTGHDAGLTAQRRLVAAEGVFTLTGHDALFTRGRAMPADAGVFTLAGHDAALIAARRLIAETGAFSLTGHDAQLLVGLTLVAETGAFVLTGHAAALLAQRVLAAAHGTFALTGHDAALTYSGFVPGTPGPHPLRVSFTLLGKSVTFESLRKRAAFDLLTKSVDLEA